MSQGTAKSATIGSTFNWWGKVMIDRYLKIVFAAQAGLMALLYVAHNWANYGEALAAFGFITTLQGHEIYPTNLLPALPPALQVVAMWMVFISEMLAAGFMLWGSWAMWQARGADSSAFTAAKTKAKIGCAFGVFVWWGLFQTIAAAGYQMWQSPAGEGPFYGSFMYGAICFVTLIYVSMRESDA